PVREPVDDQLVARPVAQAERLDGDPLTIEDVPAAVRARDRAQPAQYLLERPRPVLLGAEQQPDQVPGGCHWRLPSCAQSPIIRTWCLLRRAGDNASRPGP